MDWDEQLARCFWGIVQSEQGREWPFPSRAIWGDRIAPRIIAALQAEANRIATTPEEDRTQHGPGPLCDRHCEAEWRAAVAVVG